MNRALVDDFIKKIAKGGVWLLMGMIASRFFNYFYKIIIARIGVEELGIFSIAMAITGTLSAIGSIGLPMALFYLIPRYHAQGKKDELAHLIKSSLKILSIISLVFALSLFLFSDFIALRFFRNQKLGIALRILSFSIPLINIRNLFTKIHLAYQRVDFRVFTRNFSEDGVRLVTTIFFILIGLGLMSAIFGYLCGILASLLLSFYLMEKHVFSFIRADGVAKKPQNRIYDVLFFSLPLFFTGFVGYFLNWIDIFLLGYFRSTQEVGLFSAAMVIGSFVTLLPEIFRPSAFPIIVKHYSAGKEEEFKFLLKLVNKWIFICAVPIVILIFIFAKELVLFIFGEKYILAVNCALIILFGKLIWTVSNIGVSILAMIQKPKFILYTDLILLFFNLVLDLMFIPKYGIIAAAFSTSFVLLIEFLIYIFLIKRNINFSIVPTGMLRITAFTFAFLLFFFLVNNMLNERSVFLLATCSFSYVFLYLVILFKCKIIDNDDIILIKAIYQATVLKLNINGAKNYFKN